MTKQSRIKQCLYDIFLLDCFTCVRNDGSEGVAVDDKELEAAGVDDVNLIATDVNYQ